jgi:hypothetical protein
MVVRRPSLSVEVQDRMVCLPPLPAGLPPLKCNGGRAVSRRAPGNFR